MNDEEVWAIGYDYSIWRWKPALSWMRIDGNLQYLSAAKDGTIWGGYGSTIFKRVNNVWRNVHEGMKQVSVCDKNMAWSVDNNNRVYWYTEKTGFVHVPGEFEYVICEGEDNVWGERADRVKEFWNGKGWKEL